MLGLLWRHEMRHVLRDRRALVAALLLPLLLLPLVLWGARLAAQIQAAQQAAEPSKVGLVGAAADAVQDLLPQSEHVIFSTFEVEDAALGTLAVGELDAVLNCRWIEPQANPTWRAMPRALIFFYADDARSNLAVERLESLLQQARTETRSIRLKERGSGLDLEQVLAVTETDVATRERLAGARLGRWATAVLLLLALLGGSVVAGDTLAGERERGSLETLLTSAVERHQIVLAKLLAVATFGGLVIGMQLLNLYLQLAWMGDDGLPLGLAVQRSPLVWSILICLLIPLLALVSGALLWISGRARSYKEFHFYLLPLTAMLVLPATAAALPGAQLQGGWILLPVANISLAVRAVLTGQATAIPLLGAWLVTAGLAAWTLRAAVQELTSETRLMAPAGPAGPAVLTPFEGHVGAWFVGFWCLIFLLLVHVPWLTDLSAQLVLSLVVVCFGGSMALILVYGLPKRQVLKWRMPAAKFWIPVWVGAPVLVLCNGALFRWTTELFPLSRVAQEAYGAFLEQPGLSGLEILVLAALLPAICEEIAFRGVLLSGLQRRLPELQACLVVGVTFALFHFDTARFLPTLVLGAVLALLTLRSGSIFPAMAWHALNNGLVIWLGARGVSLVDLSAGWYAAAGLLAVGTVFWLWRQSGPTVQGSTLGEGT